MKEIEVTREYLQALREAYEQAVKEGKSLFVFRGSDFVTGYAKYFLEFYEPKFSIKKS